MATLRECIEAYGAYSGDDVDAFIAEWEERLPTAKIVVKAGGPDDYEDPAERRDFVSIVTGPGSDDKVLAYIHVPHDGREPYLVVENDAQLPVVDRTGLWPHTGSTGPINHLMLYGNPTVVSTTSGD